MKNVLVVAYHFPPGGGPGVQRVLKHITYLPQAGWNPIVLTVENGDFPARDESLLEKIPSSVPVIRVPIIEPYDIYRKFMGVKGAAIDVNVNKSEGQRRGIKANIAEFIRATFFIPDARILWLRSAVRTALNIISDYDIQAVYTSAPPYTCALIGRQIKRKTKLPWVAGFRDPWTDFLTTPQRWWIPKLIDRQLERTVLEEADAVECAWQGIIEDAIRKVPLLPRNKFYHVPNGFDSADFPNVEYSKNERFTITYTGSMYGVRNPKTFLEAFEQLLQRGVCKPENVHLRFVGRFGDDVLEMFEKSSFKNSIEVVGYVPHSASIAYLMKSEVLLIVVDNAKESAEIVPGKVYEYLGVGRPILALSPKQSAIEDLILRSGAGLSAQQEDVLTIAANIAVYYEAWQNNTLDAISKTASVSQYERKESAKILGTILDSVL